MFLYVLSVVFWCFEIEYRFLSKVICVNIQLNIGFVHCHESYCVHVAHSSLKSSFILRKYWFSMGYTALLYNLQSCCVLHILPYRSSGKDMHIYPRNNIRQQLRDQFISS